MRNNPISPTLQGMSYLTQQIGAALVEEKYGQTFEASVTSLLSGLNRFREGLLKRYSADSTSYEVDHVIEGIHMLQSLFPPKNTREANQYRIIADGVETNVDRLLAMAGDIDEQERNDLT